MKTNPIPSKKEFNERIWQLVRKIPPGKVATYGQLADLAAEQGWSVSKGYHAWGSRWVGQAMANCPEDVPWQRVVNARGEISVRPGGSHILQRALLEEEGVVFDARGRINLQHYRWTGLDTTGGTSSQNSASLQTEPEE